MPVRPEPARPDLKCGDVRARCRLTFARARQAHRPADRENLLADWAETYGDALLDLADDAAPRAFLGTLKVALCSIIVAPELLGELVSMLPRAIRIVGSSVSVSDVNLTLSAPDDVLPHGARLVATVHETPTSRTLELTPYTPRQSTYANKDAY